MKNLAVNLDSLAISHRRLRSSAIDTASGSDYPVITYSDLHCIHHLALYQVSVRRLVRFATPLPPIVTLSRPAAVRYTWRYMPVTGLSPVRIVSCPTHISAPLIGRMSGAFCVFCYPDSYYRSQRRQQISAVGSGARSYALSMQSRQR